MYSEYVEYNHFLANESSDESVHASYEEETSVTTPEQKEVVPIRIKAPKSEIIRKRTSSLFGDDEEVDFDPEDSFKNPYYYSKRKFPPLF